MAASPLIEDVFVRLVNLAHGAVPAEVALDAVGRSGAEARAQRGVAQERHHPFDEGRAVVRLDEEARGALVHHLGQRGDTERDDGLAARHRLLRRQGEPLEERREDEDVGEVQHGDLVGLGQIAGEDHRAFEPEAAHQRLELRAHRARAHPHERDVRPRRAPDLGEGLDQENRILSRDKRAEREEDALSGDAPAARERLVARRLRVLGPDPAIDDAHVIGPHTQLVGELPLGELAVGHDRIGGLDHALFEVRVERARVEVMVMRHHRHGQAVAPPSPERGGTHEPHRVDAQHVEARGVPESLDVARPHERGHVPPQPLGGPHGMNRPPFHVRRVCLTPREQDVTLDTERGQVLQELPFVDLAPRAGLGRDAAVR
jgi:hypothetical protein